MKIAITKRSDDYMAYIAGNRAMWDCGKTANEAIGKLIVSHGSELDIELIWEPVSVKTAIDMDKFYNYVLSFYGSESELYPMGATLEQIKAATAKYIASNPTPKFIGDSADRERVRDILIEDYNLVFPK